MIIEIDKERSGMFFKKSILLVSIIIVFIISSMYVTAHVKIYKDVKDKIAAKGHADVIIVFDKATADDLNIMAVTTGHSSKKNYRSKDLSDVDGFEKRRSFEEIGGYSGILTSDGLNDLENQGLDVTVYENTVFYILDGDGQSTLSTPLNISTAAVNANYSWNTMNITGRGVKVAIIDTGIDYTHPDLGGCFGNGTNNSCKVFNGYNFITENNTPRDDHGHGTHVAGILAAKGNITGVAPDSILYAVKACDSSGLCTSDNILAAMIWAQNANVSVISISLGFWVGSVVEGNSGRILISQEVKNLTDSGIVVVTAAGNSGPGVSSILSPADAESTITVGAVVDNATVNVNDDMVWYESSRGPSLIGRLDPELVAPGYAIVSTDLYDTINYSARIGTSMAAPFVSGAAALLLEKYPSLNPLQVRAILLQSTTNISGKVFAKGSGELNLQNALSGKVYALVNQTDTYNRNKINDRWEFVILPSTTARANITIVNDNNYNITFGANIEDIISMENNDLQLSKSQMGAPNTIVVSNNSNYTFEINFTLTNFDSIYATTYGGIISFNGSGYNGTANVIKNIRVPVIITVPIVNNINVPRIFHTLATGVYLVTNYPHDDIYSYCYYNPHPRNLSISINWSDSSNDLDLFVYDSNSTIDTLSANGGTESEAITTSTNSIWKWFRVDGFDLLSVPFTFDINLTAFGNNLPLIENITDDHGTNNGTINNPVMIFYRPEDIILNITYYDADNDTVNITVNDSEYVLLNNSFDNITGRGNFIIRRPYNSTIPRESIILLTLNDYYGGSVQQEVNVWMYSSIRVVNYTPSNAPSYVKQNDSMLFTVNAYDTNNNTLYYYWNINGTFNSTAQDFIFNSAGLIYTEYTVGVVISNNDTNNDTNETQIWNVYIDRVAPSTTIQSPTSLSNNSKVDINYTVNDAAPTAGITNCWYSINGTTDGINYTSNISSSNSLNIGANVCANTSIYLGNGSYTLRVYANDTVGNMNYTERVFAINDTASPNITVASSTPQGHQPSYVSSVILSIYTDENATCRYSDTTDMDYVLMTGTFSDYITNHTTTFSTASSSSTAVGYTLYVRCSDMSNNIDNVSIQLAFTIPAHHSGGSGSGDSGGGGGGGSGGSFSNVVTVSKNFDNLIKGQNNMSISSQNIPISQVNVNMSERGYNATLSVSVLDAPITDTLDVINESIFSYLSINLTEAYLKALRGTEIYFGVTQKWLHDNNITKDDVVMLRYNPSTQEWDKLPTELLNENVVSLYYVAHSPSLGMFVISYNRALMNASAIAQQDNNQTNQTNISNPNNPVNIIKTLNEIRNGSVAKLNSEEVSSLGRGIALGNSLSNILEKMMHGKENMWILWVLSGTFVGVIALLVVIKSGSKKYYEDELILATNKEFKNSNKEFVKKVSDIPKDLEAIEEEVKKKFDAEIIKSVESSKPVNRSKPKKEPKINSKKKI